MQALDVERPREELDFEAAKTFTLETQVKTYFHSGLTSGAKVHQESINGKYTKVESGALILFDGSKMHPQFDNVSTHTSKHIPCLCSAVAEVYLDNDAATTLTKLEATLASRGIHGPRKDNQLITEFNKLLEQHQPEIEEPFKSRVKQMAEIAANYSSYSSPCKNSLYVPAHFTLLRDTVTVFTNDKKPEETATLTLDQACDANELELAAAEDEDEEDAGVRPIPVGVSESVVSESSSSSSSSSSNSSSSSSNSPDESRKRMTRWASTSIPIREDETTATTTKWAKNRVSKIRALGTELKVQVLNHLQYGTELRPAAAPTSHAGPVFWTLSTAIAVVGGLASLFGIAGSFCRLSGTI